MGSGNSKEVRKGKERNGKSKKIASEESNVRTKSGKWEVGRDDTLQEENTGEMKCEK